MTDEEIVEAEARANLSDAIVAAEIRTAATSHAPWRWSTLHIPKYVFTPREADARRACLDQIAILAALAQHYSL